MRLFIAIVFNSEIKDRIYNIIKDLKDLSVQGNFVDYNNLHVTLSFLGELQSADKAKKAMDMAISNAGFEKFTIAIKNLSKFNRKEGDILIAEIEYNECLYRLQTCLTEELIACGFKMERREYKPHITLARKAVMQEKFELGNLANQVQDIKQKVDKISLMKSERIKGNLVYTEIYEKDLL